MVQFVNLPCIIVISCVVNLQGHVREDWHIVKTFLYMCRLFLSCQIDAKTESFNMTGKEFDKVTSYYNPQIIVLLSVTS